MKNSVTIQLADWQQLDSKWLDDFSYHITHSWTAICCGALVGVALVGRNAFHPTNAYLKIMVAPEYRRQGIGTALFEVVRQRIAQPLQAGVMADDQVAVAFLAKQKFHVERNCFEYELASTAIKADASLTLQAVSELKTQQQADLQKILVSHYVGTHEQVNAVDLTLSEVDIYQVLTDQSDLCVSQFYQSGTTCCYALVETEVDLAFVTYVGYVGERRIYQRFLETVLARLKRDYKYLCFEIDDTDEAAMCLVPLLSVATPIAYQTYIHRIK